MKLTDPRSIFTTNFQAKLTVFFSFWNLITVIQDEKNKNNDPYTFMFRSVEESDVQLQSYGVSSYG